jgi:predicted choloylglycine hydrolase
VLPGHEPLLVRNYDLDPGLSEATLLCSAWLGRRVIATSEAIAGAADGVNADGLAVSLTFGGRRAVGPGFGIPLILRYVLEVCATTAEAVAVLRRVPSHMSYNVTVVDRAGDYATVFLAPDRPVEVTRRRYTTNHQARVDWPEQAWFSRTIERADHLKGLLGGNGLTAAGLTRAFLEAPLFSRNYAGGFGTVYTAAYRPLDASLTLHWPGMTPWRLSCADFAEGSRTVKYSGEAHRPATAQALPPAFVAALAECLERPIAADWARLGQFWAGAAGASTAWPHTLPIRDAYRPSAYSRQAPAP